MFKLVLFLFVYSFSDLMMWSAVPGCHDSLFCSLFSLFIAWSLNVPMFCRWKSKVVISRYTKLHCQCQEFSLLHDSLLCHTYLTFSGFSIHLPADWCSKHMVIIWYIGTSLEKKIALCHCIWAVWVPRAFCSEITDAYAIVSFYHYICHTSPVTVFFHTVYNPIRKTVRNLLLISVTDKHE